MGSSLKVRLQNLRGPRLQTDANQGGVEKLSICERHPAFGYDVPFGLSPDDVAPELGGLVSPCGIFMVKGWARGIAALGIMLCAFEEEDFFAAMPQEVKEPAPYILGCGLRGGPSAPSTGPWLASHLWTAPMLSSRRTEVGFQERKKVVCQASAAQASCGASRTASICYTKCG